jgi:hypothetical protein
MTLIFPLLLFLLLGLCVAFLLREGMWSNAVRLVCMITAGLLAMNFFEPVAKLLDDQVGDSYTYFWDFVALWGLFALSLLILRLLTDTISRVRVRFLKIVDQWGGVAFAVCCGWFMVCFTTATLHTAPLARNFLYGGFKVPPDRNFFGLAPDWQWLGFVRHVSGGVYSRNLSDQEKREGKYGPGDVAVFDSAQLPADKRFISRYALRRDEVERMADSGSFRVPGGGPKR